MATGLALERAPLAVFGRARLRAVGVWGNDEGKHRRHQSAARGGAAPLDYRIAFST